MRKVMIVLIGLLFLHMMCIKVDNDSYAIEIIQHAWEEEGMERLHFRRNLARWYNLNLASEEPDSDFHEAYQQILSYEDGMMGYIEIPKYEMAIPIYHTNKENGFVHDSDTSFPIGQRNSNSVLTYQMDLSLEDGDSVIVWILGEPITYVLGQASSVSCTLICRDTTYACGRVWEDQGIPMDISNKKY